MPMKYLVAWEHPTTGRVSKARMSFSAKELAENTVRTLSRLRPEREYWVESEDEAAARGLAGAAQRRGATAEVHSAAASDSDLSAPAHRPARRPPANRQADLGWLALPAVRPDGVPGNQQI